VNAPAPRREDRPSFESPPAQPAPYPRRISSHALLGSGREVEILHGTQLYRLRLTSLGKLILTK
jgi:hemin uptake protein HemP